MATRRVKIGIEVDKKGATKGIKDFGKTVTQQNKKMRTEFNKTKKASAGLGLNLKTLAGAAGGLLIFSKINSLFKESIALAGEQASAVAKVEQTIKATGGAAGITSEEMQKMASAMQSVTTFGDEVILRGQSMLLTFKKIGKDVFPAATETMLNLSVAMGTDVKESAIQLGKALNDPITGLTALRRVGITFSKSQETVIKNFQKSGDIASAQKLILKELESQFGGLARAVALTGEGPLIQFNNIVGDVKELLGDALIPVILEATAGFKQFLIEGQETGQLKAIFEGLANSIRFLFAIVQDTFRGLSAVFKIISAGLNSLVGLWAIGMSKMVSSASILINFLPDKLVPDGWKDGIANTTLALEELGRQGLISGKELFDEGVGSVSEGSRIIAHFKKISSSAKEAKKAVADIPGATGIGGVGVGDISDPKANAKAAKVAQKAADDALKAAEKKAEADKKFIETEFAKFEEALTIREEFRRMSLSQDEQDILAFQDQLKEKNLLLREAGFEELDIVQMVIDRRNEMEKAAAVTRQQIIQASLSSASTLTSALGSLSQVRIQNEIKEAEAAGASEEKIASLRKKAFEKQKKFSLVGAFINTAQAITGGLATQPFIPLGIIAAATAAAAGAIQISAIKAQTFQTGGVVQGQRSGDRVPILANGGERVLTVRQNQLFERFLEGRGGNTITFQAPVINIANGNPDTIRRAVEETMQEQINNFAAVQRDASVHEILA